MSVELVPAELGFKRPFIHEVAQTLRLHNPTSDPIAFKVKTTAPKQYCVRPNSGRIAPGQDVEVQVLLQAMKEDPPADTRCRDKFLVQSVAITPDKEAANINQIWANIEQTAKSSIQEKKIRVSFLPADGSSGAASHDDSTMGGHQQAYSSPSPVASSPQQQQRSSVGAVGPVSTFQERPADHTTRAEAVESAYNPAMQQSHSNNNTYSSYNANSTLGPQLGPSLPRDQQQQQQQQSYQQDSQQQQQQPTSTLGSMVAAVSNAIPTSQSDLQQSLDAANAKIKELQLSASEGLRQRKLGGEGEKTSTTTVMGMQNAPAPGGVPVQYVAALCLMCFLLAYLFF